MEIIATPKQDVQLSTPEENKQPETVIRSTQSEKQASCSTSVNDVKNTHERQQRTEPLLNLPFKHKKKIGLHKYDLNSAPTSMFYLL